MAIFGAAEPVIVTVDFVDLTFLCDCVGGEDSHAGTRTQEINVVLYCLTRTSGFVSAVKSLLLHVLTHLNNKCVCYRECPPNRGVTELTQSFTVMINLSCNSLKK